MDGQWEVAKRDKIVLIQKHIRSHLFRKKVWRKVEEDYSQWCRELDIFNGNEDALRLHRFFSKWKRNIAFIHQARKAALTIQRKWRNYSKWKKIINQIHFSYSSVPCLKLYFALEDLPWLYCFLLEKKDCIGSYKLQNLLRKSSKASHQSLNTLSHYYQKILDDFTDFCECKRLVEARNYEYHGNKDGNISSLPYMFLSTPFVNFSGAVPPQKRLGRSQILSDSESTSKIRRINETHPSMTSVKCNNMHVPYKNKFPFHPLILPLEEGDTSQAQKRSLMMLPRLSLHSNALERSIYLENRLRTTLPFCDRFSFNEETFDIQEAKESHIEWEAWREHENKGHSSTNKNGFYSSFCFLVKLEFDDFDGMWKMLYDLHKKMQVTEKDLLILSPRALERSNSACMIQRVYRSHLSRKRAIEGNIHQKLIRNRAAIILQRLWRWGRMRKRLQMLTQLRTYLDKKLQDFSTLYLEESTFQSLVRVSCERRLWSNFHEASFRVALKKRMDTGKCEPVLISMSNDRISSAINMPATIRRYKFITEVDVEVAANASWEDVEMKNGIVDILKYCSLSCDKVKRICLPVSPFVRQQISQCNPSVRPDGDSLPSFDETSLSVAVRVYNFCSGEMAKKVALLLFLMTYRVRTGSFAMFVTEKELESPLYGVSLIRYWTSNFCFPFSKISLSFNQDKDIGGSLRLGNENALVLPQSGTPWRRTTSSRRESAKASRREHQSGDRGIKTPSRTGLFRTTTEETQEEQEELDNRIFDASEIIMGNFEIRNPWIKNWRKLDDYIKCIRLSNQRGFQLSLNGSAEWPFPNKAIMIKECNDFLLLGSRRRDIALAANFYGRYSTLLDDRVLYCNFPYIRVLRKHLHRVLSSKFRVPSSRRALTDFEGEREINFESDTENKTHGLFHLDETLQLRSSKEGEVLFTLDDEALAFVSPSTKRSPYSARAVHAAKSKALPDNIDPAHPNVLFFFLHKNDTSEDGVEKLLEEHLAGESEALEDSNSIAESEANERHGQKLETNAIGTTLQLKTKKNVLKMPHELPQKYHPKQYEEKKKTLENDKLMEAQYVRKTTHSRGLPDTERRSQCSTRMCTRRTQPGRVERETKFFHNGNTVLKTVSLEERIEASDARPSMAIESSFNELTLSTPSTSFRFLKDHLLTHLLHEEKQSGINIDNYTFPADPQVDNDASRSNRNLYSRGSMKSRRNSYEQRKLSEVEESEERTMNEESSISQENEYARKQEIVPCLTHLSRLLTINEVAKRRAKDKETRRQRLREKEIHVETLRRKREKERAMHQQSIEAKEMGRGIQRIYWRARLEEEKEDIEDEKMRLSLEAMRKKKQHIKHESATKNISLQAVLLEPEKIRRTVSSYTDCAESNSLRESNGQQQIPSCHKRLFVDYPASYFPLERLNRLCHVPNGEKSITNSSKHRRFREEASPSTRAEPISHSKLTEKQRELYQRVILSHINKRQGRGEKEMDFTPRFESQFMSRILRTGKTGRKKEKYTTN